MFTIFTTVNIITKISGSTNLAERPGELGKCATEWGVVAAMEAHVWSRIFIIILL